jgi:Cof subfamily protein (haloacid dehalogenase superfamily)
LRGLSCRKVSPDAVIGSASPDHSPARATQTIERSEIPSNEFRAREQRGSHHQLPPFPKPKTDDPMPPAPNFPSPQTPVRLVISDLDGSLLDAEKRIPSAFWPLLHEMNRRGVIFVPASGRQYETIRLMFAPVAPGLAVIAENGAYVVRDGIEISSNAMDREVVHRLVRSVRELVTAGNDVGIVVCGKRSAYVERVDDPFIREVEKYYAALDQLPDLLAVDDAVVKVAVFDFASAETNTAPALASYRVSHQVVVSGDHWIDITSPNVNKGMAVRGLQRQLNITAQQTVVFGDYLNDLEMLDTGELSFAMANAHPQVLARARYEAPSNTNLGVVKVLTQLLNSMPKAEPERHTPAHTDGGLASRCAGLSRP